MEKVFRRAASSWLSRAGGGSQISSTACSQLGSWDSTSILTSSGASCVGNMFQTSSTNAPVRGFSTGRDAPSAAASQASSHAKPSASDPQNSNPQQKLQHASPAVTSRSPTPHFPNLSPQSTQQPGNLSLDRARLFQTSADTSSPSSHIAATSATGTTHTPSSSIHLRFNHPPTFPGPFKIPPGMLSQDILTQVRDSIFGAPIEPLERTGRRALAKPLQGAELASWYFLPPKETPGFHNEEYEHSLIKAQMKRRRKEEEEGAPERKKKKKK